MNRRRSVRQSRRIQVQFWQDSDAVRRGVTTNVSSSGMHIATADPLPPTSRLRIEVVHEGQGFMVEGIVAHRRSVHPELTRVATSGMGVRFLTPEELMSELFQSSIGTAPISAPTKHDSAGAEIGPLRDSSNTFAVRFANAKVFEQTFERDIANGGLFVSTSHPARLHEFVQIEIHPPEGAGEVVVADARVVQRFQPKAGSGAIVVGMGVELLELPLLLHRLQPIVDTLKQRA